jgi:hypothetical protein
MRRNEKQWSEFDELTKPFLPEETAESAVGVAIELRNKLTKIEQQVLAQYTAMASYATIAQQNVDAARAESRADLDRMQGTVIGLVEKLRAEMLARLSGADHRAAPLQSLSTDGAARLSTLEDNMRAMAQVMEVYARENVALKARVAELTEAKLQEQGWLVTDASDGELTLR